MDGRRSALASVRAAARSPSPDAQRLPVAIAAGLISVLGMAASATHPHTPIAWLATALFAVAASLTVLCRLPRWGQAQAICLCGLAGVTMQALHLLAPGLLMVGLALGQASRLPLPLALSLSAALGVGYEAVLVAVARASGGEVLGSSFGLAFAYLVLSAYRRLQEEKKRTEALLAEVVAGREATIHAAMLDERAHLAREMHDLLAHTLSALAVQLETTRRLVEQRPDDPAAPAALARASALARAGLEEATRAVGALRGGTLPGPEALPQLAATFEREAGIPCRCSVEGTPAPLSADARLAIYRTAQEALTNVRKHALATVVSISLRYLPGEAALTVENEGAKRPAAAPGGGHGLEGMRERAALARGRLEAGSTPTGFWVCLRLPT